MTPSLSGSLSAVSATMSAVRNHVVDSLKPKNFLRVGLAAAPVFTALKMMSSLPGADAGFICFSWCMGICTAGTGGAFIPACVTACIAACANPVTP